MKKIALIGSAGVPGRYGGFETLADQLVTKLEKDFEWHVYCTNALYKKEDRHDEYNGAKLHHLPLKANGWQSLFYDAWSIIHALFYADTLLILGVAGMWLIPFIRLFSKKEMIVHVDGLEWRRPKWGKYARIYLKWAEKTAAKHANKLIADNKGIADYLIDEYGSSPAVIEYGGDQAQPEKVTERQLAKYPFLHNDYAFSVCRIEPENNLHVILKAFAWSPDRRLVIIGNWKHSTYGQNLVANFSGFPNIVLLDPIYEPQELNCLRSNCSLYVHGHSAGGTNPSLVEAMNLRLPILAFDVNFNQATTEGLANFFSDADSLKEQLNKNSPAEWQANGILMKNIAERRYTWSVIAKKYTKLLNPAFKEVPQVVLAS